MDGTPAAWEDRRTAIYTHIAESCPPAALPHKFKRIPVQTEVRSGHPDPAQLQAALEKNFVRADLLLSNALIKRPDESCALHPDLAPGKTFVVLRKEPGAPPFDFVGETGCLSRTNLPIMAVLDDSETWANLRQKDILFVVFSVGAMAVLRAMGFAAATAAEFGELGGAQLGQFCERMWFDEIDTSPGADTEVKYRKGFPGPEPKLVLTAWQPEQLDLAEPVGFDFVKRHFEGIHHSLQIDVSGVRVWKPTPADVEHLEFSLRYGKMKHVRHWIETSFRDSAKSIVDPNAADSKPKSYPETIARLVERARGRQFGDLPKRALDQARAALEADLIQRILTEMTNSTNPVDRNAWAMLAELSRMYHSSSFELLYERIQALRDARVLPIDAAMLEKDKRQLALSDRIFAWSRELNHGKRRPKRAR